MVIFNSEASYNSQVAIDLVEFLQLEPTHKKTHLVTVKKALKLKAVSTFGRNAPNEIYHHHWHFLNFENGKICSHCWSTLVHASSPLISPLQSSQ